MQRLGHIDTWIFDLDNTLYPARTPLFPQIDAKMSAYVQRLLDCDAAEARRVQKHYFYTYGTTLRGLIDHHGVDPQHFLDDVHAIDMSVLEHDARVVEGLALLPGRKLVFTNGDAPYARRVLDALGLGESFEAIHDIHATNYVPKPTPDAYRTLLDAHDVRPETALFVEDMVQNLKPAKAVGMTTVWVNNGSERGDHGHSPDFVDHEISDVGDWLDSLHRKEAA
jgi:putative hydrolase of the HAD superfamily